MSDASGDDVADDAAAQGSTRTGPLPKVGIPSPTAAADAADAAVAVTESTHRVKDMRRAAAAEAACIPAGLVRMVAMRAMRAGGRCRRRHAYRGTSASVRVTRRQLQLEHVCVEDASVVNTPLVVRHVARTEAGWSTPPPIPSPTAHIASGSTPLAWGPGHPSRRPSDNAVAPQLHALTVAQHTPTMLLTKLLPHL